MPSYRLVHAADLHLDSPFRGLRETAPAAVGEMLREATFRAFENIVDLCIREQAHGLLIAGDVYDGADRSLRAQLRFVQGLERLAAGGVRAFICHGNHDPLDGWEARLTLPPTAHRFGPTVEAVPLDPNDPASPLICGISYATRDVRDNLVLRFPPPDAFRPTVGLLHANVGNDTGHEPYAPCRLEDLLDTGYTYWALGHVHTRHVWDENRTVVAYPGNPQGRHPDEPGARGVLVAEIAAGRRTVVRFEPVDLVRWTTTPVSIDSLETEQHLLDATTTALEAALEAAEGRSVVVRLTLTGRGPLHAACQHAGFLNDVRTQLNESFTEHIPFAYCATITDATAPSIDLDALREGQDFTGEFLRLAQGARTNAAFLAVARELIRPLYDDHRARHYLRDTRPNDLELTERVADAENIALTALLAHEDG